MFLKSLWNIFFPCKHSNGYTIGVQRAAFCKDCGNQVGYVNFRKKLVQKPIRFRMGKKKRLLKESPRAL